MLLSAILSAIGFTAEGVAAGSFAAAWQSWIGNVVMGSIFATLQSMAATGATAMGITVTGVVGGLVVGIGVFLGWKKS